MLPAALTALPCPIPSVCLAKPSMTCLRDHTFLIGCALILLLLLISSQAAAVVPLPTVGHWTLDETSGGTAFDSINGNHGIWDGGNGNNTWTTGLIGGGSLTNDENGGNGEEHFTIPSLPELVGADGLTISIWFNQNSQSNNNSTYNALFMTRFLETSFGGGGENWGIALEDTSAPRHIDWRIDGSAGNEDDIIAEEPGWHHVAFTWDGVLGQRALFLDGTELQRQSAPTGTVTGSGSWDIGNDTCCSRREFTGTLDDLAVWDTALDAQTVSEIYFNGLIGVNAATFPVLIRGDVDVDGDVDFDELDNDMLSDLDIITSNYDAFDGNALRTDGDLTADGYVNFADAIEWRRAFDLQGNGSHVSPGSIPEPTASMIALITGGLLLVRRQRFASEVSV